MRIKLDLDDQATALLIKEAVADRRPVHWQAEILLRRARGPPERCEEPEREPATLEDEQRLIAEARGQLTAGDELTVIRRQSPRPDGKQVTVYPVSK